MLSREVVETMYPEVTFGKFLEHQVRWARTVRLCRPASYLGLLFTHGLPLAIAGAIASRSAAGILLFMAGYAVLRLVVAGTVGMWGLRDETARRKWWMLPLRDLLQFAVWVGSFFSNRITWGNAEFELSRSGEMVAIGNANVKNSAEKPLRTG
jgi:ceramide glucosyltransferase